MLAYRLGLEELPLFTGLTAPEVQRFVDATGALVKRFDKGARILKAFEANPYIGVIVEGTAQVIAEDRLGEESVSHVIERGALIGSTSAIMPQVPYEMGIEALTPVIVLFVPYRRLITAGTQLTKIHGIVMKNLLESFCRKNILMMQKIELLSQKTLRERLILYLLQRERRQGRARVAVPGRVQLARELECNRSALTREIAAMRAAGMLTDGEGYMELDKSRIGHGKD